MVDCTRPQDNAQYKQKYGVRSFPTVIFTDAEGKELQRLQGRAPAQVLAQIQAVVATAGPPPIFEESGLAEARAKASSENKLLGVLFLEDSKKRAKKNEAMLGVLQSKDLAELRERMVLVRLPLKDGKKLSAEAKAHRASSSPTLVVVDPKVENSKKAIVKKIVSPRGMEKTLGKIIKKALGG